MMLKEKQIKHERFVGIDGYDGDHSQEKTVGQFIKAMDYYKGSELYELVSKSGARVLENGWGAHRSAGSMGCLLSHLKILKDAIKNKYEKILLFQDDIYFHKEFEELLSEREEKIKRSSLFYLGATEHANWIKNMNWWWRNPHWGREHHKKGCYNVTTQSLGMFAVIIDKKVFEPMIRLAEFELLACDQALAALGTTIFSDKSFVAYPNLIMPDTTHSHTASDVVGDRSFQTGKTWRAVTSDFMMGDKNPAAEWAIEQGWDHNYYDLTEKYYE